MVCYVIDYNSYSQKNKLPQYKPEIHYLIKQFYQKIFRENIYFLNICYRLLVLNVIRLKILSYELV